MRNCLEPLVSRHGTRFSPPDVAAIFLLKKNTTTVPRVTFVANESRTANSGKVVTSARRYLRRQECFGDFRGVTFQVRSTLKGRNLPLDHPLFLLVNGMASSGLAF